METYIPIFDYVTPHQVELVLAFIFGVILTLECFIPGTAQLAAWVKEWRNNG